MLSRVNKIYETKLLDDSNKLKQTINILASNVEGESKISSIKILQIQRSRIIFAIILGLLTFGIFFMFLRWFQNIKIKFLYVRVEKIDQCTHVLIKNNDGIKNIQSIENFKCRKVLKEQDEIFKSFVHRKLRYIYFQDNQGQEFVQAMEYPITQMQFQQIKQNLYQLSQQEVQTYRNQFGQCEKVIEIPNIFQYLLKELTTPFYFLQYVSVVLWIFENYLSFAIIVLGASFSITFVNYFLLRISLMKIQSMSINTENVEVFRTKENQDNKQPHQLFLKSQQNTEQLRKILNSNQNDFQLINSKEIVVGDIIKITEKLILPCDVILISGEALVNEVSLTGESVPIPKVSISDSLNYFEYSAQNKKHLLYEGTQIYQIKQDSEGKIFGKVIRVGFSSLKGQILRSVLFPIPTKFEYYQNSFKYLQGLLIAVLIVYFIRVPRMYELNLPLVFYFYRFLDAVTWIIPPFLPVFMSLSASLALIRLRLKNIFGTDPNKTFVAGKVDYMCFDKTGTLTNLETSVKGYYETNLKLLKTNQDSSFQKSIIQKLFATCHGVYQLHGELVGDMLDLQMFQYSGYQLENTLNDPKIKFKVKQLSNDQSELTVLKVNEFESENQRMSCLVQDNFNGKFYAFLKGAPETLKRICLPQTIPNNFDDELNINSLKGYRILGFAFKEISQDEADKIIQSQDFKASRELLESNINFMGLLVLQNSLKSDTQECIQRLLEAQINCKVISGDSPFTTIQASLECQILNKSEQICVIDRDQLQNIQVMFIKDESISKKQITESVIEDLLQKDVQMAITGNLIDHFKEKAQICIKKHNQDIENDSQNILSKQQKQHEEEYYFQDQEELLSNRSYQVLLQIAKKAKIFSRMRPEQKKMIIELLQQLNIKVGMIGDGANDCSAIKQADIGISFNSTDAALSAPFSSSSSSIKCVEYILLEGRSTMAIKIEIFRVIVTQNILKYLGVMILLQEAQNFGGFQYTYLSYFLGMPLMVFLSFSSPENKLTPYTPDVQFQKLPNQLIMFSQFIIYGIAFAIGYILLKNCSWHSVITTLDEENGFQFYHQQGEANSVIFLMLNMFFTSSCFSYFESTPFKQIISQNYLLFSFMIMHLIHATAIIISPELSISSLGIQESLYDKQSFLWKIYIISVLASALVVYSQILIKKILPLRTNEEEHKLIEDTSKTQNK